MKRPDQSEGSSFREAKRLLDRLIDSGLERLPDGATPEFIYRALSSYASTLEGASCVLTALSLDVQRGRLSKDEAKALLQSSRARAEQEILHQPGALDAWASDPDDRGSIEVLSCPDDGEVVIRLQSGPHVIEAPLRSADAVAGIVFGLGEAGAAVWGPGAAGAKP